MNGCIWLDWIHNCFLNFTGVPIAGALDHLLPHLMPGALQHCLQILMVAMVHQAIQVAAPHLVEVALDHQLQAVIEPMILLLVHGVQIRGHLQHQELWHRITHHLHRCVLAVKKQDLVAHSYPVSPSPYLIIQWLGLQLERQKSWYGFLKDHLLYHLIPIYLKWIFCSCHQEFARIIIINTWNIFLFTQCWLVKFVHFNFGTFPFIAVLCASGQFLQNPTFQTNAGANVVKRKIALIRQ